MWPRFLPGFMLLLLYSSAFAQEKFTVLKDLRADWLKFEDGEYRSLATQSFTGLNTIYFTLEPHALDGSYLRLRSDKPYFVFVNGKVLGEYRLETLFSIDSLKQVLPAPSWWIAIHQNRVNERDLKSEIVSARPAAVLTESETAARPYSAFRDFVVISGLLIILLFVAALRLNPKLGVDYFSISRLLSLREADDGQTSARLTSGANIQFFILCSLMIGFYLQIVLYNLPSEYALPIRFQSQNFWMMWWQWLRLSAFVFSVFVLKILIIFSLTRLFGMRGMARLHFFNWVRLLLVVFGSATIILFMYFIVRGDRPYLFVVFLSVVVAALIAWIVVAFFKLSGRSGHSMFHLFSYLCATEIIPLIIIVKVLFQ